MQTESTLRFKKGFLYLKPSANSSYNITRATLLNPNEYAAGYYAFSIERNASDTVIQLSPVTDPVNAGFQLNIDNSGNVYRGGYSPYLETMDYLAVPTWAAIHI